MTSRTAVGLTVAIATTMTACGGNSISDSIAEIIISVDSETWDGSIDFTRAAHVTPQSGESCSPALSLAGALVNNGDPVEGDLESVFDGAALSAGLKGSLLARNDRYGRPGFVVGGEQFGLSGGAITIDAWTEDDMTWVLSDTELCENTMPGEATAAGWVCDGLKHDATIQFSTRSWPHVSENEGGAGETEFADNTKACLYRYNQ